MPVSRAAGVVPVDAESVEAALRRARQRELRADGMRRVLEIHRLVRRRETYQDLIRGEA